MTGVDLSRFCAPGPTGNTYKLHGVWLRMEGGTPSDTTIQIEKFSNTTAMGAPTLLTGSETTVNTAASGNYETYTDLSGGTTTFAGRDKLVFNVTLLPAGTANWTIEIVYANN